MELDQDWLWQLLADDPEEDYTNQNNLPNGKSLQKGERP